MTCIFVNGRHFSFFPLSDSPVCLADHRGFIFYTYVHLSISQIYGYYSVGHKKDFLIQTYLNFIFTCFEICVNLTLYGILTFDHASNLLKCQMSLGPRGPMFTCYLHWLLVVAPLL